MTEAISLAAGQAVRYVITNSSNKRSDRKVVSAKLVENHTRYVIEKYVDLLISAITSVLTPFGYAHGKSYKTELCSIQ